MEGVEATTVLFPSTSAQEADRAATAVIGWAFRPPLFRLRPQHLMFFFTCLLFTADADAKTLLVLTPNERTLEDK
jgi:hypothetical protein